MIAILHVVASLSLHAGAPPQLRFDEVPADRLAFATRLERVKDLRSFTMENAGETDTCRVVEATSDTRQLQCVLRLATDNRPARWRCGGGWKITSWAPNCRVLPVTPAASELVRGVELALNEAWTKEDAVDVTITPKPGAGWSGVLVIDGRAVVRLGGHTYWLGSSSFGGSELLAQADVSAWTPGAGPLLLLHLSLTDGGSGMWGREDWLALVTVRDGAPEIEPTSWLQIGDEAGEGGYAENGDRGSYHWAGMDEPSHVNPSGCLSGRRPVTSRWPADYRVLLTATASLKPARLTIQPACEFWHRDAQPESFATVRKNVGVCRWKDGAWSPLAAR